MVKNLTANAGDTKDTDSIPGSRRSPGVGNGNPLHGQISLAGYNPRSRKASDMAEHTHTHTHTHTNQLTNPAEDQDSLAMIQMHRNLTLLKAEHFITS